MTGEVIYTPPEGQKLLLQKLENWADFMKNCVEVDPLVRMAVQHYQFEAPAVRTAAGFDEVTMAGAWAKHTRKASTDISKPTGDRSS